ncbi:MAG: ATP-binding protein [Propionibacteriales bacterium]|nr:ATP-binding protein [Propionibacteriales bacterium]
MGTARRGRPAGWPLTARTLAFFSLFTAFGLVGRTLLTTDGRTALIWPAAGVAALWLGTAGPRRWGVDVIGLAVATVLVNAVTGATAGTVVVLIAANVLGAVTFVHAARRTVGHLWGLGGDDPLARLADLGHLVVASVLSGLASAVIGWAGLQLTEGADVTDLLVWWCRCSIGTMVIGSLGILVVQPVRTLGVRRWITVLRRDQPWPGAARVAEAGGLVVVTGLLAGVVLYQPRLDSLVFVLVLTSVWAGLRFSPVLAMLHAMALGWTVLVLASYGHGPFTADGQSDTTQALLAQGFVAVLALTALVLTLGRSDLDRTSRALTATLEEASARTTLLDTVLRTMREGLTVVDEQGNVYLHNPALATLLGLPADDPERATSDLALANLFHPDGRPVAVEDLPGSRALAGEEVTGAEFHVRSPLLTHGRIVEMGAHLLPGTNRDGSRRALVNVRDVTADRQHRDALANFAGTVAHDLFTPLTMVNGWAENLVEAYESGEDDPDLSLHAARRIHASAQHMRDVIRDLLAYAVARDQTLHLEQTDLTALAEQLAELSRNGRSCPRITVEEGIVVRGDRVLLRQLFQNLIDNAVKYATPGVRPQISIRSRTYGDAVEIRVTDNGIGIEPEEREHVFAPYHRVDETGRGTGLGLAICWRIVDRHGGRIWIEDGPGGRGTTVVLRLVAGRGTARHPEPSPAAPVPDSAA